MKQKAKEGHVTREAQEPDVRERRSAAGWRGESTEQSSQAEGKAVNNITVHAFSHNQLIQSGCAQSRSSSQSQPRSASVEKVFFVRLFPFGHGAVGNGMSGVAGLHQ